MYASVDFDVNGSTIQPISSSSTRRARSESNVERGAWNSHESYSIAIILSGELEFTVGAETRVMHAGECVVIPPNVPHGGVAGPQGCEALDVFTPPRAGIVRLMG